MAECGCGPQMGIQWEVVIVLHVSILLSATVSSVVSCGSSILRACVVLLYNSMPSAHTGWTGESKSLFKKDEIKAQSTAANMVCGRTGFASLV